MTASGDGAGMRLPCLALLAAICLFAAGAVAADNEQHEPRIVAVDRVWSAHPVQFGLADDAHMLVWAYYDANRQLTLASATERWSGRMEIPPPAELDRLGQPQLAGDRTRPRRPCPRDRQSPQRSAGVFPLRTRWRHLHDAAGAQAGRSVDRAAHDLSGVPATLRRQSRLKYRNGGNGSEIYVVYSEQSRSWIKLLDTPLLDGEDARSGYPVGQVSVLAHIG